MAATVRRERLLVLGEIALIFAVFVLYGAWPVPDSNEAHYLGKVIHFWNPAWGEHDFFLDSTDPHVVFCVGFGWLSRWLSPDALAWVGRLTIWWFLAWAWRRLNWAALGERWWSIATAAAMLFLVDHFAIAGEWIIGGAEAKGFAYVLVLLGLEAIVRGVWNRAWLCFGGAGLIHILVGGWSAVAAGLAWLLVGRGNRPPLRSMWPWLVGGLLLATPGLVASLRLVGGVDPAVADQAHQIYVFQRLGHHLNPAEFPVLRFIVPLVAWVVVGWQTPQTHPARRLHAFVAGTVLLSMAGFVIAFATCAHPGLAAAVLRFYWFRMADIMVPLGVAVGWPILVEQWRARRPAVAKAAGAALLLLAAWEMGGNVYQQAVGRPLRSFPGPETRHFAEWRDACRWIAGAGRIPRDATFLTPRTCRTFKWYTGRAEVVNWKDVPQDSRSIVEWWRRQQAIHATDGNDPQRRWFASLAEQGEDRLRQLGRRYHADYVLTENQPRLDLPVEYENDEFVIYRLADAKKMP